MKSIRLIATLTFALLLGGFATAHDKAGPLNDAQKAFLQSYEKVRAALAADNLTAAQAAAEKITDNENAARLAEADSISEARDAFKLLSKRAVHLASGQQGFYLVHCPMVEGGAGDWVQTDKNIANPYFGKSMLTCGSLQK